MPPTMATSSTAAGKDKMEPMLLALMQNQGVEATLLDKMGDAGLTSLNVFACLRGSRDKFVEVLEKPPLDVKATDFAGSLEQAKLLAAWEAANTMEGGGDKAHGREASAASTTSATSGRHRGCDEGVRGG